jgi:hypothetical protein
MVRRNSSECGIHSSVVRMQHSSVRGWRSSVRVQHSSVRVQHSSVSVQHSAVRVEHSSIRVQQSAVKVGHSFSFMPIPCFRTAKTTLELVFVHRFRIFWVHPQKEQKSTDILLSSYSDPCTTPSPADIFRSNPPWVIRHPPWVILHGPMVILHGPRVILPGQGDSPGP